MLDILPKSTMLYQKKYVDSLIQHEHDVALHNVGRYIVMPNEEDGTKTYFSVRAEKNVDLDENKLVEIKAEGQNNQVFHSNVNQIAISGVPIPTSPNDRKDLQIMRLNQPLEIFFNRRFIQQPWNLSFSAKPGSQSPRSDNAISLTFQANVGYFNHLNIAWTDNGITYTVLNHTRETIHEALFELDVSEFNHISIEYVENKVCFWINGHQMNAMYRTQAFRGLVKIDMGVKELGILTFYDRSLRKSEIVQHFIDKHVDNFTDDIVLIIIKMKKELTAPPIYPELPRSEDQGVQFRLNKISEIRDFLENEVNERDKLRRKYKTFWNVFLQRGSIFGFRRGRIGQRRGRNSSHRNRGSRELAARWNRDLRRRSQRIMRGFG